MKQKHEPPAIVKYFDEEAEKLINNGEIYNHHWNDVFLFDSDIGGLGVKPTHIECEKSSFERRRSDDNMHSRYWKECIIVYFRIVKTHEFIFIKGTKNYSLIENFIAEKDVKKIVDFIFASLTFEEFGNIIQEIYNSGRSVGKRELAFDFDALMNRAKCGL